MLDRETALGQPSYSEPWFRRVRTSAPDIPPCGRTVLIHADPYFVEMEPTVSYLGFKVLWVGVVCKKKQVSRNVF